MRTDVSADALRDEHERLDRQFADLCNRADSGDWQVCDEIWDAFAADLEDHLAYEERFVFPDYERSSDEAAFRAIDFHREHRFIRSQLAEIGIDIQLHVIRAWRIEAFVAALRTHAEHERETFYLWLAARQADARAGAPKVSDRHQPSAH